MRWLLDSNVLIAAFAGESNAVRAMNHARDDNVEGIGSSAITRLEVRGYSGLSAADEKGLTELLAKFAEAQVTPEVISRTVHLRRNDRIKTPDALIAATALLQGAEWVARNKADFKAVPGSKAFSPQAH